MIGNCIGPVHCCVGGEVFKFLESVVVLGFLVSIKYSTSKNTIKSNLVSFGLLPDQIEQITDQIVDDVIAIFNNYELDKICL